MAMHSPIEQFEVHAMSPAFFELAGQPIAFTNAALAMVMSVVCAVLLLGLSTRRRAVIPSRWQLFGETIYNAIFSTMTEAAGDKAKPFIPFILSLFMFIVMSNLLGLIPGVFTPTSQLIVNITIAVTVMVAILGIGFKKHGLHFLHLFVPSGVPGPLIPFISTLEFVSFWIRPCSLSLRLFANMLAGHILLKVFAGMAGMVATQGVVGVSGIFPVALNIVIVGFEVFVALLQAYIFTMLSSVYLRDALEMH